MDQPHTISLVVRGVLIRGMSVALCALVLMPSVAAAASPGRNGLLAVDPPGGHGVVLATGRGHVVETVCPARASCDGISDAMWTPDGQALSFLQAGSPRVFSLVYPDGSCLSCDEYVDPAVTGLALTAHDELFMTEFGGTVGGTVGGVDTSGFEGTPEFRFTPLIAGGSVPQVQVVPGDPSQPAIAGSGREAFVSHANGRSRIYVLDPGGGKVRQIALGADPSWSVDGRQIAFTARGWIRVVSLAGRHSWRIVRGHGPVFSPDGRRLAYIGRQHKVWTIRLRRHSRPRRAGGLRATHLDWQALPKVAASCFSSPGGHVVSSGPGIEIVDDGSGVMGCLMPEHRTRVLLIRKLRGPYLDHFRFAGSSVAYQRNAHTEESEPCANQVSLVEVNLAINRTALNDGVQNVCSPDGAPGSFQLNSWVLTATGAIAFIQSNVIWNPDSSNTTTDTLQVHDASGLRTIDSASSTGAGSTPLSDLAVSGSLITWRHLGQPRSAQLGGSP